MLWAVVVNLKEVNLLWFSAPLIVVISLVYSATRYEDMGPIFYQAFRLAIWITAFMAAILGALTLVERLLL